MYKFLPYMTNDFSVGLYCEGVNDIYHSAFGALAEAYEKFVLPSNVSTLLKQKDCIRVLDICYGVGYNTKAFINEVIKTDLTDKKIVIDCVDNDEILIQLSPFISSKINFLKRFKYKNALRKNVESYGEAKKILSLDKGVNHYKLHGDVQKILIKNLIENFDFDFLSDESKKVLAENENHPFFDVSILKFYKFLLNSEVELYQNKNKSTFVHNIYYKNISKRFKKRFYKKHYNNINLNFYSQDIRQFLLSLSDTQYDLVFLDGFTPSKCPCIWSVEFFNALYKHIDANGLILTYNTSSPVRNAMIGAGFYIGDTIFNDKIVGTTASKNKALIKFKISDKNLGLLNTKAGIPYRDENLSLKNDTIILNRNNEVKSSDLVSSSKYLKQWENKK